MISVCKDIRKSIQNVLSIERDSLNELIHSLDYKSDVLVKLCHECRGKVVWIGMGKSGHVARKISATMASLGTPSFFLHPAEAAHGDLGMLQNMDIVILVSNSGNTDELIQLIPTIKVIGCKLIGIFCKSGSILSEYCDLEIVLPVKREACINNLAPTTSTTVTLAYGDALAVAISELNHFAAKDFALFHPLGALGKKLLLTAIELAKASKEESSVLIGQITKDALFTITKNHLGAVAVVDGQTHLAGIISDGDIRRLLESRVDILELAVEDIMTKNPVCMKETVLAVEALEEMKKHKISVMPLINKNGQLMGMLSLHDIIGAGIV